MPFSFVVQTGDADLDTKDFESLEDFLEAYGDLAPPARVRLSGPLGDVTIPKIFAALVRRAPQAEVAILLGDPKIADSLYRHLPKAQRFSAAFQPAKHLTLQASVADLIELEADAVVNASNTQLVLGGGVSAAIRAAAGPGLQADMLKHKPASFEEGDAIITASHGLSCTHIIHLASAAGDPEAIRRGLKTILSLAIAHGFKKVVLPALGTGTGGLPLRTFARILKEELAAHSGPNPQEVEVPLWTKTDFDLFCAELKT